MKKEKGFLSEFKKFIMRGNVMDMAVGVIVGGAFSDAASRNLRRNGFFQSYGEIGKRRKRSCFDVRKLYYGCNQFHHYGVRYFLPCKGN